MYMYLDYFFSDVMYTFKQMLNLSMKCGPVPKTGKNYHQCKYTLFVSFQLCAFLRLASLRFLFSHLSTIPKIKSCEYHIDLYGRKTRAHFLNSKNYRMTGRIQKYTKQ